MRGQIVAAVRAENEAFRAKMWTYNARFAPRNRPNEAIIAAYTGKITKCPAKRRG